MKSGWQLEGVSRPVVWIAASSMLAMSSPSAAADLDSVYDWGGLYIGAFGGIGDVDNDGFFATSVDLGFGGSSWLAGARIGWNWQRGNLVYGIEQDASWFDWHDVNLREENYQASADFISTLRGRVGWADDNILFYITAGGAFIHADVDTSLGGRDVDQQENEDSKDVSAYGGVAGAGIEWGLTRNLSLSIEGLYMFFDSRDTLADLDEGLPAGGAPDAPDFPIPGVPDNNFKINDGYMFRFGLNWHLWNPDAPEGEEALWKAKREGFADYDWNGFYVGAHAGFGGFSSEGAYRSDRQLFPLDEFGNPTPGVSAPVQLDEFINEGVLEGLQAGINWQSGPLVFGIEADVSGVDWDDEFVDLQILGGPIFGGGNNPIAQQAVALDANLLATARARAGWAHHNMLYYGTAGLAYLDAEFKDITNSDNKDVSAFGPVVGAGVEWGYRPDLTLKAEVLYFMFDETTALSDLVEGAEGDHLEIDNGFAFRVGANYRPGQSAGGDDNFMARGAYDWTGAYAGAHFGWGGLVTDGLYNMDPLPSRAIDLTNVNDLGVVGGGQIGVNWQIGALVAGVEGDISAVDWDGHETEFHAPSEHMDFLSDYLATLRARIGYADDNLLLYVTAGIAYLDAELDNTGNLGTADEPGSKKNLDTLGTAIGLGMEWGITPNLSAKAEGLFLQFNEDADISHIGSEGDPGDFFRLDDGFIFRLGANWRFNPFYASSDYENGMSLSAPASLLGSLAGMTATQGEKESKEGAQEEDNRTWVLSGILNRALVVWDDGDQVAVNSVDNPQDSSAVELNGKFDLPHEWSLGITTTVDTMWASADTVDQIDWTGDEFVAELPYLFAEFSHENYGRFLVGLLDSASDEIDNINLAESDAVADASFDNFVSDFFLRAEGIPGRSGLATGQPNSFGGEARWGDFIEAKFAGASGRFITYISPNMSGLEVWGAVGQPQEIFLVRGNDTLVFNERTGGVYADGALRYAKDLNTSFRLEGGVGVWSDTTEEEGATEPTEDLGFGGSLALKHIPTGLNASVNFGNVSHTDDCADPGLISGKCRGDDAFVYLKGGAVRDLVDWGPTAFYGEYLKSWKSPNDSDMDLLVTLRRDPLPEPEPDQLDEEVKSTEVTGWGFGVVQHIEAINTELYLGFRHYNLDTHLIDEAGTVPSRDFEDLITVVTGLTLHWGGRRETEDHNVETPGEIKPGNKRLSEE
jgi:outer membrane immunogenic protein